MGCGQRGRGLAVSPGKQRSTGNFRDPCKPERRTAPGSHSGRDPSKPETRTAAGSHSGRDPSKPQKWTAPGSHSGRDLSKPERRTAPGSRSCVRHTTATARPFVCARVHVCKSLQSCLTLGDPVDPRPPGSSVHGFSRQEYWRGLPCPPPGDLSNPGIEPRSLMSPALIGGCPSIYTHQRPTKRMHSDPQKLHQTPHRPTRTHSHTPWRVCPHCRQPNAGWIPIARHRCAQMHVDPPSYSCAHRRTNAWTRRHTRRRTHLLHHSVCLRPQMPAHPGPHEGPDTDTQGHTWRQTTKHTPPRHPGSTCDG